MKDAGSSSPDSRSNFADSTRVSWELHSRRSPNRTTVKRSSSPLSFPAFFGSVHIRGIRKVARRDRDYDIVRPGYRRASVSTSAVAVAEESSSGEETLEGASRRNVTSPGQLRANS